MTEATWAAILQEASPQVRQLAEAAGELIRDVLPDASQEADLPAKLLAFTYAPGTYKGLVTAVAVHKNHVNIMFSDGAALAETDDSGLLEGTGRKARHIKVTSAETLKDPHVRYLIKAAAALRFPGRAGG
jgi:hypothetical protein